VVKIWQLIGGFLAAGAPCHGTTGTMVNPALLVPYNIADREVDVTGKFSAICHPRMFIG